jgi:hypothetical protein
MCRNEAPENVGQRVLAIARHFGKPSLFITITTNPPNNTSTRLLCLIQTLFFISPLATESDSSFTPASPATPRKGRLGEAPTLTAALMASTETLETVGGEDVHVEGNDADSSPPATASKGKSRSSRPSGKAS